MNIDVLMPYRAATEHRRVIHEWTRERWELTTAHHPNVRLIVSDDGQQGETFSVSRAVNRAYRHSRGDAILIFGSGHLTPSTGTIERIETTLEQHHWLGVYKRTHELDEATTRRLLRMNPRTQIADGDLAGGTVHEICAGIVAMRTEAFQAIGGADPDYNGWGWEDNYIRLLLGHLYGKPPRPVGTLTTLWHPPSPRANTASNEARFAAQAKDPAGTLAKALARSDTPRSQ